MTPPRNVLYVSHTPALTGSAVSLHQLMLGLDRTRYRPIAAFSKPGYLVEHLAGCQVDSHVLRGRGWLGWRLVTEARTLMDRAQVELVHLNSAVPFCKYLGIAARSLKIPVVWHIREDPRGKRVRRLKKWIWLLAQRVFVVSSELEDFFRAFPVVKIFNGVDVERFHPGVAGSGFRERFGIPADAFLFGIVGTIEERKGTLTFLEAAQALLNRGRDACFAVVGDGLAADVQEVRDFLAARPALSARTVLTGRLDTIPEVMAGIDVLAMPSLWEGFPRSLIEAMASETVAIATDTGEIATILEQGRSGTVISRGDPSALIEAMDRWVSNRDRLAEVGKRARQRVLEEFTLQRHVERVQSEYDRLLDQR